MVVDSSKFQSPIPFFIQLKRLVFGVKTPDLQTKIVFRINFIITVIFIVWNVFGAIAVGSRDFIRQKKGIAIEKIISGRADSLGYKTPFEFMDSLYTYYTISVICWLIILIGLILLYRKKRLFLHFTITGLLFFTGMTIFYIGFDFFMTDITGFDKICLLILAISIVIQGFLLKNEQSGGSSDFFGELDENQAS